jgi:ligand-binding sensor domain-containing protein
MIAKLLLSIWKQAFILFVGFVVACFAAVSITVSDLAAQPVQPAFQRFSVEQGLSHASAHSIVQDSTGFIWVASDDGLNRYDGTAFTQFHRSFTDSSGLPSSFILSLSLDSFGILWISTEAGLAYYEPRTGRCVCMARVRPVPRKEEMLGNFTTYVSPFLAHSMVRSALRDKRGTVWVASTHGISRYEPRTRLWHHQYSRDGLHRKTANYQCTALGEDAQGRIWAGCHEGWLVLMDSAASMPTIRDSIRLVQKGEYGIIENIKRDVMGNLWCCVGLSLVCVHPTTRTVVAQYRFGRSGNAAVYDVAWSSMENGVYWVATSEGLFWLDARSGARVQYTHQSSNSASLAGNICSAVLRDKSGVLWVGSASYGVSKYAPYREKFRVYRHDPLDSNSLSDNFIRNIWLDKTKQLWVCTQYGGLNLLRRTPSGVQVKRLPYQPGFPRNISAGVYQDCTGQRWVGLHNEQALPMDSTGRWRRSALRFPVLSVWERGDGSFWATGHSRLCKVVPKQHSRSVKYEVFEGPTGAINLEAVCEDREGSVWFGGENGLLRWKPLTGERVKVSDLPEAAKKPLCTFSTMLTLDSRGNLWVATKGGGISRYDYATQTFTHITTAQGLPHNNCYALLEDKRGRLWISTDRGLAVYDTLSRTIRSFGVSDGLQGWEFNRRAYHRAATGEMFFGGVNGINSFFPDSITINPTLPCVVITAMHTGSQRADSVLAAQMPARGVWNATTIELDAENIAVTFSFLGLEFTSPEHNQYRWCLEGLDKGWTAATTRHEATYSHLPPGTYIFRVQASNNDGIWNKQGAFVRVIVRHAWWQHWQTHLLAVLLLVISLWSAYTWRVRVIERRTELLQRLVEERTQELQRTSAALTRSQVEVAVLQEIDEERRRISRDIHDDVGAHLTNIALWSELAVKSLQRQSTPDRYIHNIARASQSVVQNLSSII